MTGWPASTTRHLEPDYEFVALHEPDEYAIIGGRIRSTKGIDDRSRGVERESSRKSHIEWSNASSPGSAVAAVYHVGPLARFNLNFEQLHPAAREAADPPSGHSAGAQPVPKHSRSEPRDGACRRHRRSTSLARYRAPDRPTSTGSAQTGEGHGASEAPRGLLYHRYRIDDDGLITDAQIVPPTSQNQLQIEADLRQLLEGILDQDDAMIQRRLEQAIRNYDPCISCATHFLELDLDRR